MKLFTHVLFVLFLFLVNSEFIVAQQAQEPVPVIYDTDMGPMIDDVGALAMLHAFSDNGEAEILATVASNRHPTIAQVISVFNTYFNNPKIPIGVPKGPAVEIKDTPQFNMLGGWTNYLVNTYPSVVRSNDVVPDAVDVYRRVLSEQEDNSVVIVTVGFLTNLADLLASGPDEYSDLNGLDLVERKVRKLVSMAGAFPEGNEYNLREDTRASLVTFEYWPTEIIFSGFEIGREIQTGYPLVKNESIQNSPVRDTYKMKVDRNRSSFDHTAVLVAVRGTAPYYDLVPGRITVNLDGTNGWDDSGQGHYYMIEKMPPDEVGDLINELIQHEPSFK